MTEYTLPGGTNVAFAHLKVSFLSQSLTFYEEMMGFRQIQRQNGTVALSANGSFPAALFLTQIENAVPKPARTTGLYHIAIRLPTRNDLGRVVQRLLHKDWRFSGAADHGVSEAFYTVDPDGNGIELYADRPASEWPWKGGQVGMVSDPLDVNGLFGESGNGLMGDLPAQTVVGHVHLQVSDLRQARRFYHDLLGLTITQSDYPGALFLAAGKYHHHVGLNVWAGEGAPPPPPAAVGLMSFGLRIPSKTAWLELMDRLKSAGVTVEEKTDHLDSNGALVFDPDGNGVELLQ